MQSNTDGTTGFLGKLRFFNSLGKSVVLILHYQLPFLQSSRSPGKMNWTGAQLNLENLSSVLEL